jgi:hypothetical protein
VRAVEAGEVSAISEALKEDLSNGKGREEIAAFAISTQGLSPLVSRCRGAPTLPAALSDFLSQEDFHSKARARRLVETLAGTVRALRAAGVEVVALKGATLAFFHYPDPALRPMGDLDLLLRDPRDFARATAALVGSGWHVLLDTPRHRVFARPDELIARPASEDPNNPMHVEIHPTFRLPFFGRFYDASAELRAQSETRELGGARVAIAAGPALLRHLLFHAAGDFEGSGIRGIQAHDFRLLARARGALIPEITPKERERGAAPLLFAVDAVERLFPNTFEPAFVEGLASRTDAALRARAAAMPSLRYTRPTRGWSRGLLSLIDRPIPKARFIRRTLFPTLGEVKANAAPGASGLALSATWVRIFARRVARALIGSARTARLSGPDPNGRVLGAGEYFVHERFGPGTVNRGAVLWECEWNGGVFEAGVMLGGIFRAGEFRDGVVWTTLWKGGVWKGGFWHNGFAPDGAYRPRGASPGSPVAGAEAPESPIEDQARPRVTVFTASVFGDVPRIWLACLRRSLPPDDVRFEVFDDSPKSNLDAKLLPDATLLRRSAERPDFEVAYADALRRATTPFLAFVDTDVFWLSPDVWPRVMREFERPRVAGVTCVSRASTASPGTFAVVMRTEVYRDVVRNVPGAFAPFAEREVTDGEPGRWSGNDTADRVSRAVKEAGFELPLLDLPAGALVKFDAITMTRLLAEWVGEETLLKMVVTNPYFRRGCLGGLALARVHDVHFTDGPRFGRPLPAALLWRTLLRHPRTFARAARDFAEFREGAKRIRRLLGPPQRGADASAGIIRYR